MTTTTYTYQIYAQDSKGNHFWVCYPDIPEGYIGYYYMSPNQGDGAQFTITKGSTAGYYLSLSKGIGATSNYNYGPLSKQDKIINNYEFPQTLWEFAIENDKGNLVAANPTFPLYGYQCYIKDLSFVDDKDQRWWKFGPFNDQLTGDPLTNTFANPDDYKFYITVGSYYTTALVNSPYVLATSNKSNESKNIELNWSNFPNASLTTFTQCSPEFIQSYKGKIINETKLFMANQEFSLLIDNEIGNTTHNFSIIKRFGTVAYIAKFNDLYIFASSKRTISSRSWDKLQKFIKRENLPILYSLYNVIRC